MRYSDIRGIIRMSTQTSGINIEKIVSYFSEILKPKNREKVQEFWTDLSKTMEEKISFLLNFFNEGIYIVLFDNMEDLLDKNGMIKNTEVRKFLKIALNTPHNIRFLITTRERINIDIKNYAQLRNITLNEGLSEKYAIKMLKNLDPSNELSIRSANPDLLTRIIDVTQGVPRALEVFVSILLKDPTISHQELINQFFELKDVNEMIIEGYKRLDRDEKQIIDALAVYRVSVSKIAVEYLLKSFNKSLEVPGLLKRLVNNKMISINRKTKKISLHPIDKHFAYSTLPEKGEYSRKQLEIRAAKYYEKLCIDEQAWNSINDITPQLYQIKHLIRAELYDKAYNIIETIDSKYLRIWGHVQYSLNLRKMFVDKLSNKTLNIKNLNIIASRWSDLGFYQEARKIHKKILDSFDEKMKKNDSSLYSKTLFGFSINLRSLGEYDYALKKNTEALDMFKKIDNKLGIASCLGNLGEIYLFLGKYDEAINKYNDALSIFSNIDQFESKLESGRILCDLGLAYRYTGYFTKSLKAFQASIKNARELNYKRGEAYRLNYYGELLIQQGKYKEALKLLQKGLHLAIEIKGARPEILLHMNLGAAKNNIKDGSGEKSLLNALDLAEKMNTPREYHFCNLYLGRHFLFQNKTNEALEYLKLTSEYKNPEIDSLSSLYLGIAKVLKDENASTLEYLNNVTHDLKTKVENTIRTAYYSVFDFFSYYMLSLIIALINRDEQEIKVNCTKIKDLKEDLGKGFIDQCNKIIEILKEMYPKAKEIKM